MEMMGIIQLNWDHDPKKSRKKRREATMRSCLYRVKDLNPPLNKAMQHQVGNGNGKIGEIAKLVNTMTITINGNYNYNTI